MACGCTLHLTKKSNTVQLQLTLVHAVCKRIFNKLREHKFCWSPCRNSVLTRSHHGKKSCQKWPAHLPILLINIIHSNLKHLDLVLLCQLAWIGMVNDNNLEHTQNIMVYSGNGRCFVAGPTSLQSCRIWIAQNPLNEEKEFIIRFIS